MRHKKKEKINGFFFLSLDRRIFFVKILRINWFAEVAELADALGSGPSGTFKSRGGSNPPFGICI